MSVPAQLRQALLTIYTVSSEYDHIVPRLWTNGVFWFTIFVLPILCLSRDFAWKSYKRFAQPEPYHIVQEIQKYVSRRCLPSPHTDTAHATPGSIYQTIDRGKRNSRRRSKRSEHCNAREGIVVSPSLRRRRARKKSFAVTIRQ